VSKFIFEVNGVVGSLFKVCESYSEAHLYLKENFVKEHPAPLNSPPLFPEGGLFVSARPTIGEKKRYFQGPYVRPRRAQCDRRSVKGKEGKLFGNSVLDKVKLRNGLVPDPEHLPDIMKKHLTEQMADCVACPWSEVHVGDLYGEHSDILTHSLATLVGKQKDEAFGGNSMDTQ
jgi:hypothetical protein